MRKKEHVLLLKDFLETRNLEECWFQELELALENVMYGNIGSSALYHLDNMCYDVFKTLPNITEEKHLFRFVRFPAQYIHLSQEKNEEIIDVRILDERKKNVSQHIEKNINKLFEKKWNGDNCKIIEDIKNNAITLSSTNSFNDPMDPLIKAWLEKRMIDPDDKYDKILYQLIEKTLNKIRICCLVDPLENKKLCDKKSPKIEDCSPLMWAHYADSHKGICIQYKVTPKNLIDDKNRIVRLLDVNYKEAFPLDGDIPYIDSLVVKSNCWSYENETRLILYSRKNETDYCQLSNFEIEAVYMGWRIDKEKRDYLKKMLKNTNIKLYQMVFSPKDITKLVAKECR